MTGAPMGLGGTRLIGTGSATPDGILTNADLEKILDTSDEWIQQRTGIKQRRVVDQTKGESTVSICCDALEDAIKNTGVDPDDIDLIICATCTQQMSCPSVACRAAERIGATRAAAFDLAAACSGFVYALKHGRFPDQTRTLQDHRSDRRRRHVDRDGLQRPKRFDSLRRCRGGPPS